MKRHCLTVPRALHAASAAALALLLTVATAAAQARGAAPQKPPAATDPAAVVTALYRDHFAHEQSWDETFKRNRAQFDPAFLALIDEVNRKQAATPDEIVGLDFDPLTNAQEEASEYQVKDLTREGDGAIVSVSVRHGTERRQVRVRLVPAGARWLVTNILYDEGDLVAILKDLQ
jgi:hypothetical protein